MALKEKGGAMSHGKVEAKGTVKAEAPVTKKPTMGAKSTSIIRSFTETWTSVYAGSPSVK